MTLTYCDMSNFSIASIRPLFASDTRSQNSSPRPTNPAASLQAYFKLEVMSLFLASMLPFLLYSYNKARSSSLDKGLYGFMFFIYCFKAVSEIGSLFLDI